MRAWLVAPAGKARHIVSGSLFSYSSAILPKIDIAVGINFDVTPIGGEE